MFTTDHFTFPLSSGALVASFVIDIGITAVHLAVEEYQNAANFNVHSVDGEGD
jgi:hypothetical protein